MNHHLQNYNSLTEKLIQNGIIPSSENSSTTESDFSESTTNFFEENSNSELEELEKKEENSQNIFSSKLEEEKEVQTENLRNSKPIPKKRLNNYDSNLIENPTKEKNIENPIKAAKAIERFLNFKQNSLSNSKLSFKEAFFARFFPRLYKARLVKEAMSKFLELNIDTQTLLDKTIPYGENETRYEDLVKFLNYANELQTRLK